MKKKFSELKLVSWVKPKDLFKYALMVIAFTVFMVALIYLEDIVASSISTVFNELLS